MIRIFISYRRADSRADTGRLYDRLKNHFSDEHVFMDIDDIEPGANFVNALAASLDQCDVLLAVMGRDWLNSQAEDGASRLDDQGDFVRIEILRAMERGIRVIPILVGGATMPQAHDLPNELSDLARHQAYELSDRRFHTDVDQLITALERTGGAGRDRKSGVRRFVVWGVGAALVAAVTIGVVRYETLRSARAQIDLQLTIGDRHFDEGQYELARDTYREALATDAGNIDTYRRIITTTREQFLRSGIGSTSYLSLAVGRSNLNLAPIAQSSRLGAVSVFETVRVLKPSLADDVDLLLDEAAIYKAGIVDIDKALPVLRRAQTLAPARPDVIAELGMLEVVVENDPNGLTKIRRGVELAPTTALWRLYLGKALSEVYRCGYRGESPPLSGEASQCADAIRAYRKAYTLAGNDDYWSRHVRRHAVREALDIFHRYAIRDRDLLTDNLDMSLPERIEQLEFLRPLEAGISRSGWFDHPEYWLATLYAATNQPDKAEQILAQLLAERQSPAPQWQALYDEVKADAGANRRSDE